MLLDYESFYINNFLKLQTCIIGNHTFIIKQHLSYVINLKYIGLICLA